MKLIIEGYSDDLITVDGDLKLEFDNINQDRGLVIVEPQNNEAVIVNLEFDGYGYWRIKHNGSNLQNWKFELRSEPEKDDILIVENPSYLDVTDIYITDVTSL